jgi:Zn finger protein HypA/HybF involved in hydrogenase expression
MIANVLWGITPTEFKKLVASSSSFAGILRYFKLADSKANRRALYMRMGELQCNISHFTLRKRVKSPSLPNFEIFCEHSPLSRKNVKMRILRDNLLPYVCKCGNSGNWEGKKLVLQLEHKNGIGDDNRLNNLEFICPNCHSQTATFAGRQNALNNPPVHNHHERWNQRKLKWPTKEELEYLVWSKPTTELAKEFEVSDSAISRWCRCYSIKKPGRGYWTAKKPISP